MAAGGAAVVVAADISPARAAIVAANAARLGGGRVATVVADGTTPPWPARSFDRVLVDAPCSGLGVLRRRPDARWRVRPGDVDRLAALQRRLLVAALPLVRPGGVLAYSVCTMTAEETRDIDNWLARTAPHLAPVAPPGAPWQHQGRGALLLPQTAGTDGMYLLALRVPEVG
jgi:16S rRNA (cytosine967-C5)-methyltransferase